MIDDLKLSDIDRVVGLRRQVMAGFLSELGAKFLKEYYKAAFKIKRVKIKVARDKNKVIGFVTITFETKGLYWDLLKKNFLDLSYALLGYIISHPNDIFKLLATLSYVGFHENGAEILSIAVDLSYQRKGWGGKLFYEAVREFKKKKIKSFRISTYANDESANKFYRKMGCSLEQSFDFHGEMMNYYRYIIPI